MRRIQAIALTILIIISSGNIAGAAGRNDFSQKEFADRGVNVKWYGAKGNGKTDDTVAIQKAIDSLGNSGGVIYIPYGKFKITQLKIETPNVILQGNGTLYNGTLVIGNDTVIRELDFIIDGITFAFDSIQEGRNSIELQNVRIGNIDNCKFRNADKAIYVRPIDAIQHTNRITISNNKFYNPNYTLYIDRTSGSDKYMIGDFHYQNNQSYTVQKSHVFGQGVDGMVITGNTFFFTSRAPQKAYNIYLDYANWIIINSNNLFEAGKDSIYLSRFQNTNVSGNNIAWPGQREFGTGIRLVNGDLSGNEYGFSIISGNIISYSSSHGISVEGKTGNLIINGNQVIARDNGRYFGTTPFDSVTRNGINVEATAKNINIVGNNVPLNANGFGNMPRIGNYDNNIDIYSDVEKRNKILTLYDNISSVGIYGYEQVNLAQTVPTTITQLKGGWNGQTITLIAFNNNTTIANNSDLRLKGGVNAAIPQNGTLTLKYSTGRWYELSRSF